MVYSFSGEDDSDPPTVRLGPATRYFSPAQAPKSMIWHRSEQKGRQGLSCHVVGWWH